MLKKKNLVIILFFLIILLTILSIITIKEVEKKISTSKCLENVYNFDNSSPFSINKIVYFSSANCNSTINHNSSFTISDLYQYTDIAIFINNNSNGNFTAENTLKSVTLSDISFNLQPSLGSPNLYYKSINDFSKNIYNSDKKIEDTLNFNISSEDELDYSTPSLFNNCANPITLCYVNSNIKSDYTLTNDISNISYDGNLLKKCNITLNSISCKLSFLITITNNSDEVYKCPLILNMPLSTENSTIYDGSLIVNDFPNYSFIKQN